MRRLIKAGEEAKKKNLKIAAGLQCRHSVNRQELIKRIRDGRAGRHPADPGLPRASGRRAWARSRPDQDELLWQIRNFTSFLWVSGGLFAEMNIHQIDELCWIKDAWPVTAHGIGGRRPTAPIAARNLDSPLHRVDLRRRHQGDRRRPLAGRTLLPGIRHLHPRNQVRRPVLRQHPQGRRRASTRTSGSRKDNIVWEAPEEKFNPWDAEWNVLLDNIRQDKPQNEAKRAAHSNFADLMGRAAVHSGKVITWDEMTNSKFQFYPGKIDDLNYDSEPPVKPDANGFYPVPEPGVTKET